MLINHTSGSDAIDFESGKGISRVRRQRRKREAPAVRSGAQGPGDTGPAAGWRGGQVSGGPQVFVAGQAGPVTDTRRMEM